MRQIFCFRFLFRYFCFFCVVCLPFFLTQCTENPLSVDTRNAVDAQVVTPQETQIPIHQYYVPENWNGDVVVYGHGYVPTVAPVALPAEAELFSGLFVSMGYAFAVTSYPENGMVVTDGLSDLVDLADEFTTEYPQTGKVLLFGVSLGGLIVAKAAEKHADVFDGVLAMSGPYGSTVAVIEHLATFRLMFDYFFPKIIPGDALHVPPETAMQWESEYVPMLAGVFSNPENSDKVRQLLAVTRLPVDAGDPQMVIQSMIETLSLQIYATEDIRVRLGGIPFGNRFKWYRGSDNDRKLNKRIKRFRIDPVTLVACGKQFGTTGKIGIPLVSIHCTGDNIIPIGQQFLYRMKVLFAGKSDLFNCITVPGYGHVYNFTAEQIVSAFQTLVGMVAESEAVTNGRD